MEELRQDLVAGIREIIVLCCLSVKWQMKDKITQEEAYNVLKDGVFKADKLLRALAKYGNL